MRLRNIKGATEVVNKSKYTINNPKELINNYNKLFINNNPLNIEIGMGKGNFIIEQALRNPNINFIGIEKYNSVIIKAIEKIENLNIPNLKIIRLDALEIEEVFNKEVDTIYLNFSDPWPKNRHEHRRLTSSIFLKKYDNIFKSIQNIIMKTDNRKLFEYSIKSFNNNGYSINDISLDLYNDDIKDNIPTEYEKKFVSKGNIIYSITVTK